MDGGLSGLSLRSRIKGIVRKVHQMFSAMNNYCMSSITYDASEVGVMPVKKMPERVNATRLPPGIARPQSAVTKVLSSSGNHLAQN
jgi:hypothetical protein